MIHQLPSSAVPAVLSGGSRRRSRLRLLKPARCNGAAVPSRHAMRRLATNVLFSQGAKRRTHKIFSPSNVAPVAQAQPSQPAMHRVPFPARLPRPAPKEVSKAALAAAELADVPARYVREVMRRMGTGMLAVLVSTAIKPIEVTEASRLPSVIQTTTSLSATDSYDFLPSHVLAVYSSSPGAGPSKPRNITLVPTHATVLASNCASLPPLPPSSSTTTAWRRPDLNGLGEEIDASLPLVPLAIPSPETFARLTTFLYTRRTDMLLAGLLPAPPSPDSETVDGYASRLSNLPRLTLVASARRVQGLWANACALGVYDANLWAIIDIAWDVLMRALALGSVEAPSFSFPSTSVDRIHF